MSNWLVPHLPISDRSFVSSTRRKYQQLVAEDDWIGSVRAFAASEREERLEIQARWEDAFSRIAIPNVERLLQLCFVSEYAMRMELLSKEKMARHSFEAVRQPLLHLMSACEEEYFDLQLDERRAWDACLALSRRSRGFAASATLHRCLKGLSVRMAAVDSHQALLRLRQERPPVTIPEAFWDQLAKSSQALQGAEALARSRLAVRYAVDTAYWGEVSDRRAIWNEERLFRTSHTGIFQMLCLGVTALACQRGFLVASARAYKNPVFVKATMSIQRWWLFQMARQRSPSGGSRKEAFKSYRSSIRKRLVEYHDQMALMISVLAGRPPEIPPEEWELVTRLRALELGHALGASAIWRQFVAGLDRLADFAFCPPAFLRNDVSVALTSSASGLGVDACGLLWAEELPAREAVIRSRQRGMNRLRARHLDIITRITVPAGERFVSNVRWIAYSERMQRRSLEEEESLWRGACSDAMRLEAPPVRRGRSHNALVDKMLLWECSQRESVGHPAVLAPRPPPPLAPALREPSLSNISTSERVERAELSSLYLRERESMVMNYVWEAILGPNYWFDYDALTNEESSSWRMLMIAFEYDARIASSTAVDRARRNLMDDEASRRGVILKRLACAHLEYADQWQRGYSCGTEDRAPAIICAGDGTDLAHIERNVVLRVEYAEVQSVIARDAFDGCASIMDEEQELMRVLLGSCLIGHWQGLFSEERDARKLLQDTAFEELGDVLVAIHSLYIQHVLWNQQSVLWLGGLTNPHTSEPRRLSNTIASSLTRFEEGKLLVVDIEASQRAALVKMEAACFSPILRLHEFASFPKQTTM